MCRAPALSPHSPSEGDRPPVRDNLWLGGYTFVATIAPEGALAPAGILITIWLILLAVIGVPHRAHLTS